MTKFNDCIEKRLLRRDKPDKSKAAITLDISRERLMDAEISFEGQVYSAVILLSYASMFHASRALLFRDGFTERSHFCLTEFIKEKYINRGLINSKFTHLLRNAREERQEVLYGLEKTETKQDAEHVLVSARDYLKEVRKILKKPA